MLGLLTAGASASAAIVYLAHNGNTNTNWFAICRQFNSFCERISGSLIGSFVGVGVFILLILLSGLALSRRWSVPCDFSTRSCCTHTCDQCTYIWRMVFTLVSLWSCSVDDEHEFFPLLCDSPRNVFYLWCFVVMKCKSIPFHFTRQPCIYVMCAKAVYQRTKCT